MRGIKKERSRLRLRAGALCRLSSHAFRPPGWMRRLLAGTVLCFLFSSTTWLPSGRAAQGPSQDEASSGRYMGREIAQTMHWRAADWLTRGTRESEEDTAMMLQQLRLQPGQVVCDLGSGNGYHTLQMASLVGASGRVLAVDIQPEMLEKLKQRARLESISNIETIESEADDPRLPEGQLDLVLMADVYHEFSHPQEILQAVRDSLKPDGRLALLEFRAEDPDVPIRALHKMSELQIRKEMEANGFRLTRAFDGLPWQHLMFFQKN